MCAFLILDPKGLLKWFWNREAKTHIFRFPLLQQEIDFTRFPLTAFRNNKAHDLGALMHSHVIVAVVRKKEQLWLAFYF